MRNLISVKIQTVIIMKESKNTIAKLLYLDIIHAMRKVECKYNVKCYLPESIRIDEDVFHYKELIESEDQTQIPCQTNDL